MYEQRTRPLTDAERKELEVAISEARQAGGAYLRSIVPHVAVAVVAIGVLWLWLRSSLRAFAQWVAAAFVVYGLAIVAFKASRILWASRRRIGTSRRALLRGEVTEDYLEADRVAMAGYGMYAPLDAGPMEAAGLFYDLGDGRFYYWLGEWGHLDKDPQYPRRSLRVIWLVRGRLVFHCTSSGDLLEKERELPKEAIKDLVPGTVFEGTMPTLEHDIERWRRTVRTR